MNHCLFKAKDTKGAVGNTVDYSSLTTCKQGKEELQMSNLKKYLNDLLLFYTEYFAHPYHV